LDLIGIPVRKQLVDTRPTIVRLKGIPLQVGKDGWFSFAEYHSFVAAFANQAATECIFARYVDDVHTVAS
jgi:hypothetical protein